MQRRTTPRISIGRRTALGVSVLLGSALALTGCAGSAGDSSTAQEQAKTAQEQVKAAQEQGKTAQEQAEAAASAIASAVGSTLGAVAAGGVVSAQEFCDALDKAQPKLDRQPSKEIAFVTLTLELANLYGAKNALPTMDASAMDALAKSCPESRAKALKSTGKASFIEFR